MSDRTMREFLREQFLSVLDRIVRFRHSQSPILTLLDLAIFDHQLAGWQ